MRTKRRSLSRDDLVAVLAESDDVPFRRETLEAMDGEELAAAANSTGLGAEELMRRAENRGTGGSGGGGLGFEVEGVLTDAPDPPDEGAQNVAGDGSLAALRRTFSPLAPDGRAENVDELDLDVQAVMSGPRGEAALDGDDGLEADDGKGLGFRPQGLLSGHRGESALDD